MTGAPGRVDELGRELFSWQKKTSPPLRTSAGPAVRARNGDGARAGRQPAVALSPSFVLQSSFLAPGLRFVPGTQSELSAAAAASINARGLAHLEEARQAGVTQQLAELASRQLLLFGGREGGTEEDSQG